jgi:hypothetical protein
MVLHPQWKESGSASFIAAAKPFPGWIFILGKSKNWIHMSRVDKDWASSNILGPAARVAPPQINIKHW